MTAETAKKLLPIITAFAEGKTVEFRNSCSEGWEVGIDLEFGVVGCEYRIKPQELLVNLYWDQQKQEVLVGGNFFASEEQAKSFSRDDPGFLGVFKFQRPD